MLPLKMNHEEPAQKVKRARHPERVYFAQIDVLKDGQRTGAMVKLPPDGETFDELGQDCVR